MPATPVAILQLDSRSFGPAYCAGCEDEDVEEVILMSDTTFACKGCGGRIEGFDEVSDLFTSAQPICPPESTRN